MSMKICFENNGAIDVRAITTFGVSVKDKENAIGFFGTGLKYAIAIFLREGMTVELFTGGAHVKFDKKTVEVRGKKFDVVTMDGEELPFTTHLGTNWKTWMAFRELYCNTMDEDGTVELQSGPISVDPNKTVFVVSGHGAVDLFNMRDEIFLRLGDNLKLSSDKVEVYNFPSKSLFYRGIRVMDFTEPALFTYNVTEPLKLTEDRTLESPSAAMSKLGSAIAKLRDKSALRRILTAGKGSLEADIGFVDIFFWDLDVSPEFVEVVAEEYKCNNKNLNKGAAEYHRRRVNRMAAKHYQQTPMTVVEKKQLERATQILQRVWPDFAEYRVMVVVTLGDDTMAVADRLERTIVVARRTFEAGTKYLVSTLLEEYMHLKTGFDDQTRSLQTHLFDTICTLVENHVICEPI